MAAAGQGPVGEDHQAAEAMATLCETYWYPLYAFARRRGLSADDAADLTQDFFGRLLRRDFLQTADPQRGRFRSFLLTIFKRYMGHQQQRDQAVKRGGGKRIFSLDPADGEQRYRFEPVEHCTAEQLYERRWAMTLLGNVLARLRQEYSDRGQAEFFQSARPWLTGDDAAGNYAAVSDRLAMSEGALRVAVFRLRDRYRELLRQEVAGTVSDPDSVDDELLRLRRALTT